MEMGSSGSVPPQHPGTQPPYGGDAPQPPPGVAPGHPVGGHPGVTHPGAYQQPPYGGNAGAAERAAEAAHAVQRAVRTPETKPFFLTSEFLVWLFTVLGVVIAGAVVGNGDHGDVFRANLVWILVTVISFAYIISRGISKAGTKYRDDRTR